MAELQDNTEFIKNRLKILSKTLFIVPTKMNIWKFNFR